MPNDDLHHHQHPRGYRRGPRLARLLTALAVFAATTASLHALADHYGWRQAGWGGHHYSGYGFPGSGDGRCDGAQPGTAGKTS